MKYLILFLLSIIPSELMAEVCIDPTECNTNIKPKTKVDKNSKFELRSNVYGLEQSGANQLCLEADIKAHEECMRNGAIKATPHMQTYNDPRFDENLEYNFKASNEREDCYRHKTFRHTVCYAKKEIIDKMVENMTKQFRGFNLPSGQYLSPEDMKKDKLVRLEAFNIIQLVTAYANKNRLSGNVKLRLGIDTNNECSSFIIQDGKEARENIESVAKDTHKFGQASKLNTKAASYLIDSWTFDSQNISKLNAATNAYANTIDPLKQAATVLKENGFFNDIMNCYALLKITFPDQQQSYGASGGY